MAILKQIASVVRAASTASEYKHGIAGLRNCFDRLARLFLALLRHFLQLEDEQPRSFVPRETYSITVEDDEILYSHGDRLLWRCPVAKIRAVGEYTTDRGPFDEDHFIVFLDADCRQYEATSGATGFHGVIEYVEKAFGCKIERELVTSTDYASIIHLPLSHRGRLLYDFVRLPQSWWQRLIGLGYIETHLAKSAIEACAIERH